ncbi:23S rRNA (pseudouridine(1915)-N(3))-methyltransferase RlmH [Xylocopilactobacillus apicola]|uniref:Ribosomal RNA large subunit methyltransferase H n=1 Tax=Xylocopilactobacillus apicola TaxID=2932184 RepID=A0AAU9DJL4_9LACO|nr:23S rRNA (pseudouridine(1915)-N(3))-methyltransferase RlmH [Xylocopilactobacillus apicola]BDR58681.1 ribosomal RNA large subunit methyltransferase H [Xylocopilactobacillus apicola]
MLKIKIIAVGKIKEKYFQAGIDEYQKRMQIFAKTELITVSEEKFNGTPGEQQIKKIVEQEALRINEQIKPGEYVIANMIQGKQLSSIEFAKEISKIELTSSTIDFIIGGSYGLPDNFQRDLAISFGKMTFPHQLFRLVLCEQIYRALMINNHRQYHK